MQRDCFRRNPLSAKADISLEKGNLFYKIRNYILKFFASGIFVDENNFVVDEQNGVAGEAASVNFVEVFAIFWVVINLETFTNCL